MIFNIHVSSIITIVHHELRVLIREKTFLLLLGIFFGMTFFSVYIGWFTRTTTNAIYHASVVYLAGQGVTSVPLNPLTGTSALLVFDNMLIYILLIGALLAIVIGHRSFIRERKSGVIPLIFVRPISKFKYISAKLLGILIALFSIMGATFVVSIVSTLLLHVLHLTNGEYIHLLQFYLLSFVYLSIFSALGLAFAVIMPNESMALFLPIMFWVGIVFILPELSTGQNPVALLNPVNLANALPDKGQFFNITQRIFAPFSIGQIYTRSALALLETGTTTITSSILGLFWYFCLFTGVSAFAIYRYSDKRNI